jgi:hypothetical protein
MTRLMHVFPHRPTLRENGRQAPFYTPMIERDGPHGGRFHDVLPTPTRPAGLLSGDRPTVCRSHP